MRTKKIKKLRDQINLHLKNFNFSDAVAIIKRLKRKNKCVYIEHNTEKFVKYLLDHDEISIVENFCHTVELFDTNIAVEFLKKLTEENKFLLNKIYIKLSLLEIFHILDNRNLIDNYFFQNHYKYDTKLLFNVISNFSISYDEKKELVHYIIDRYNDIHNNSKKDKKLSNFFLLLNSEIYFFDSDIIKILKEIYTKNEIENIFNKKSFVHLNCLTKDYVIEQINDENKKYYFLEYYLKNEYYFNNLLEYIDVIDAKNNIKYYVLIKQASVCLSILTLGKLLEKTNLDIEESKDIIKNSKASCKL